MVLSFINGWRLSGGWVMNWKALLLMRIPQRGKIQSQKHGFPLEEFCAGVGFCRWGDSGAVNATG